MKGTSYPLLRRAFHAHSCPEFEKARVKGEVERIAYVMGKNPATVTCILNKTGKNNRKEFRRKEMIHLFYFIEKEGWAEGEITEYFPEYKDDFA